VQPQGGAFGCVGAPPCVCVCICVEVVREWITF